jgi:hypothetical protein
MSFRNDEQLAKVCNLLAACASGKGVFWRGDGPEKGPSPAAVAVAEAVEAAAVWQRVLIGAFNVFNANVRRDLEQNAFPVRLDDEAGGAVLVLSCEDALAQGVLETHRARLEKVLPAHGLSEARFLINGSTAPGLSHGETLMVRAAWGMWNGRCAPTLDELRGTLDGRNMELIGSLLMALSLGTSRAIDVWLADNNALTDGVGHGG